MIFTKLSNSRNTKTFEQREDSNSFCFHNCKLVKILVRNKSINIKLSQLYWYNRRPLYIMSNNLLYFHPTNVLFLPLTEICSSLEPSFLRLPIWKIYMFLFFCMSRSNQSRVWIEIRNSYTKYPIHIQNIQFIYKISNLALSHTQLLQTEGMYYFNLVHSFPVFQESLTTMYSIWYLIAQ